MSIAPEAAVSLLYNFDSPPLFWRLHWRTDSCQGHPHSECDVWAEALKLLVMTGCGLWLMGQNGWQSFDQLDIVHVSTTPRPASIDDGQVDAVLERYQEVFANTLGTIIPFQAKLHVTPNVQPNFFQTGPVQFVLREHVENELDRLEWESVLDKMHYSEWAAPVVAVPKPDGWIRLCEDYNVAINPGSISLTKARGYLCLTIRRTIVHHPGPDTCL